MLGFKLAFWTLTWTMARKPAFALSRSYCFVKSINRSFICAKQKGKYNCFSYLISSAPFLQSPARRKRARAKDWGGFCVWCCVGQIQHEKKRQKQTNRYPKCVDYFKVYFCHSYSFRYSSGRSVFVAVYRVPSFWWWLYFSVCFIHCRSQRRELENFVEKKKLFQCWVAN